MGCQEMKEKKKEPLNKTEKEKDKEKENDNKVENKDDDNDEKIKEIKEDKIEVKNSYKNEEEDDKKSTPLINMAQIEEHPIKSEINQMIYPDIDRNDKEDEKIESILKIDEEPYIPNYLGKLCF